MEVSPPARGSDIKRPIAMRGEEECCTELQRLSAVVMLKTRDLERTVTCIVVNMGTLNLFSGALSANFQLCIDYAKR